MSRYMIDSVLVVLCLEEGFDQQTLFVGGITTAGLGLLWNRNEPLL